MFFFVNIFISTEDGLAKKLLLFKINLLFTTYYLEITELPNFGHMSTSIT